MPGLFGYAGGKGRAADWIADRLHPGPSLYCEPFCGACSVYLARPPRATNLLNDADGELVHLLATLRDPERGPELLHRIALTPHSRLERRRAVTGPLPADPVERARRTLVAIEQGIHGSRVSGGWRRGGATTVRRPWPPEVADRLAATIPHLLAAGLECGDGIGIAESVAPNPDCMLYVDPPYHIPGGARLYAHDLDSHEHRRLLAICTGARARVAISGYHGPLYDEALRSWHCHERVVSENVSTVSVGDAAAGSRRRRVDCLWTNYEVAPTLDLD